MKRSVCACVAVALLCMATLSLASTTGGGAEDYISKDASWYSSSAAITIANNIVGWQTSGGLWPKNVRTIETPKSSASGSEGTFDNHMTCDEMRVLAKVYAATKNSKYSASFQKGLTAILAAQYPTGGWPQAYPKTHNEYQKFITFNDDVFTRILALLYEMQTDSTYSSTALVPDMSAVRSAFTKGLNCVIQSQYVQNGVKTSWGQQADPVTLAPAKGRAFEGPDLCTSESVGMVKFLMTLPSPSAQVINAVHRAVAWFDKVKITGTRYDRSDGFIPHADSSAVVWARFYEPSTNKAHFCDRNTNTDNPDIQGPCYYIADLLKVSEERRKGYAYFGAWPSGLTSTYRTWAAKYPDGTTPTDPCASVDCGSHGDCVVSNNAGKCQCRDSYTGTNCQNAPSDACASVSCGTHGTCRSGSCVCTSGYTGTHCEVAPDPCSSVDCGDHGSCSAGACVCKDGYTGTRCQTAPVTPDYCASKPKYQCSGTCAYKFCSSSDQTITTVQCPTNYKCDSAKAAKGQSPCVADSAKQCGHTDCTVQCGSHGTCTNGKCACKDGYTGEKCDTAPTPTPSTYAWVASAGACSKPCGTGSRKVTYICQDTTKKTTVLTKNCKGQAKPKGYREDCNTQPCSGALGSIGLESTDYKCVASVEMDAVGQRVDGAFFATISVSAESDFPASSLLSMATSTGRVLQVLTEGITLIDDGAINSTATLGLGASPLVSGTSFSVSVLASGGSQLDLFTLNDVECATFPLLGYSTTSEEGITVTTADEASPECLSLDTVCSSDTAECQSLKQQTCSLCPGVEGCSKDESSNTGIIVAAAGAAVLVAVCATVAFFIVRRSKAARKEEKDKAFMAANNA